MVGLWTPSGTCVCACLAHAHALQCFIAAGMVPCSSSGLNGYVLRAHRRRISWAACVCQGLEQLSCCLDCSHSTCLSRCNVTSLFFCAFRRVYASSLRSDSTAVLLAAWLIETGRCMYCPVVLQCDCSPEHLVPSAVLFLVQGLHCRFSSSRLASTNCTVAVA